MKIPLNLESTIECDHERIEEAVAHVAELRDLHDEDAEDFFSALLFVLLVRKIEVTTPGTMKKLIAKLDAARKSADTEILP